MLVKSYYKHTKSVNFVTLFNLICNLQGYNGNSIYYSYYINEE